MKTRGGWALVLAGGCLLAALWTTAAQAAAAGAPALRGGYTTHTVRAGESLQTIAQQYLRRPDQWRQLRAANGLKAGEALTEGAALRIPARLLKPAAVQAQVEYVRGAAVAALPAAPAGQPQARRAGPSAARESAPAATALAPGASLIEGSRIEVPEDGYLRLRLADGTVLRVLAGSDIALKRLRRRNSATDFESVVDVRRGKVEAEVSRQPRGRVFEIHAPGAVASVRGTRFEVAVDAQGRVGTSVTEGEVALRARAATQARASRNARLAAGQGAVVDAQGRLGARQALPPEPDLQALAGLYEDANRLLLDFGPLPPQARHEVRVARAADFREVLRNGQAQGGQLRLDALPDGDYVVGVRALDAVGLAGAEAQRRIRVHAHPVPPLYQHPAPGARLLSEDAYLLCSPVAHVPWVRIQVSSRADFSAPELDATGLARCRLDVSQLPPGDYHWRVASAPQPDPGAKGQGQGPFAPAQRFSLVPAPMPGDLQVVDAGEQPELYWTGAPGQRFIVQLAGDAAFSQVLREARLDAPRWVLEGLPRGPYYVRIRAQDADGLMGPFAPARRVHVGGTVRSGSGDEVLAGDGRPLARP